MKPIRQDRYQVGDKVEFNLDFVNSDGVFKDNYNDFITRYPNGPYEVLEVKDSQHPHYSSHTQHLTLVVAIEDGSEPEVWSGAWFKPVR